MESIVNIYVMHGLGGIILSVKQSQQKMFSLFACFEPLGL